MVALVTESQIFQQPSTGNEDHWFGMKLIRILCFLLLSSLCDLKVDHSWNASSRPEGLKRCFHCLAAHLVSIRAGSTCASAAAVENCETAVVAFSGVGKTESSWSLVWFMWKKCVSFVVAILLFLPDKELNYFGEPHDVFIAKPSCSQYTCSRDSRRSRKKCL